MINEEQKPETEAEQRDTASQAAKRPPARRAPVSEIETPPTLSGYFQERRASPSAFFKVLRKSKVKRFQANDKEAAGKMMTALDPEGERLWALMSQTSVPKAVDAWIWGASKARLGERFGKAFDLESYGAARTLKTVLEVLSPGLRSDRKEKKKHAGTWLRIAICWLMKKCALDAWQIAEELRPVFFSETSFALHWRDNVLEPGFLQPVEDLIGIESITRANASPARLNTPPSYRSRRRKPSSEQSIAAACRNVRS